MGDYYELVWLAGELYIEHHGEHTGWMSQATKLTKEQVKFLEARDLRLKEEFKDIAREMLGVRN